MATYDYRCKECGVEEEHVHKMSETPEIKCPKCTGIMERVVGNSFGGFIFKGGTPSTHWREKRQRTKRSEEMGRIQRSKYGDIGPKVQPNVAGVETGSWTDASKLAKEAGMNTESYKPWIDKEKKAKQGKILVSSTGV